MSKKIDLSALNNIVDTTWGRSSTPKASSYSVKFSFSGVVHLADKDEKSGDFGSRLTVTYIDIINFSSSGEAQITKKRSSESADRLIKDRISSLKKAYKELTGDSLKLEKFDESDSVEMIGGGYHHTPKRTAYYRKTYIFDMS